MASYRFTLIGVSIGLFAGLGGGQLGCGGPTGPGLSFRLATQPQTQNGCQLKAGKANSIALAGLAGTLRLSVVRRDSDGSQKFVCDATTRVPSERPSLVLGDGDRSQYDIHAEMYDDSGQRIASGSYPAGKSTPTEDGSFGDAQFLPLFNTADWSCLPGNLETARAFHSATLLPNGEVLLLGGMDYVNSPQDGVYSLLNSAEIYDPRHGTFVSLKPVGATPQPRAFHQAAVLNVNGDSVRLIVYGGVTAPLGQEAVVAASYVSQLRLMPAAGLAEPAGAEVVTYDTVGRTIAVTPVDTSPHKASFAGGAELPTGGLVEVGGATYSPLAQYDPNGKVTFTPALDAAMLAPGTSAQAPPQTSFTTIMPAMIAPSTTVLSDHSALALGAVAAPTRMVALALTGLPGAPQVAAAMGQTVMMGSPTVFHTATRLGLPLTPGAAAGGAAQILLTGGFEMKPLAPYDSRQPPTIGNAVRLLTINDPEGTQTVNTYQAITPYQPTGTCASNDGHYRPAGYEAATATISGARVLITGGTPTVDPNPAVCTDCEAGDDSNLKTTCSLRQVSIYDSATQQLTAGPALGIPRLGHQQTRLRDGNILVTGGLVRPGMSQTVATSEAELFNPRAKTADQSDPDDPVAPALAAVGASRQGLGLAQPCKRLE